MEVTTDYPSFLKDRIPVHEGRQARSRRPRGQKLYKSNQLIFDAYYLGNNLTESPLSKMIAAFSVDGETRESL